MKRLLKSISVLVLSLVLVVSGFSFAHTTKADEVSDWKANAIKTPTEGALAGAGYIDVEFDNSLLGYEYEVFLDGNPVYWKDRNIIKTDLGESIVGGTRKTFTSSDIPKTEVYTTSVTRHEITVKATKGSEIIISEPRAFFVSKKGLAMGDNMGEKVSLKKLNCSWYYNWGTKAFENSVDEDISHIPMMWGNSDDTKEEIANLKTNGNYILGFNEPDIDSQANFGFWEGIDTWNECIEPLNLRRVSPAPASPGGNSEWLKDFMNGDEICELPDGSWDYYYYYKDDPSIVPVWKAPVNNDGVDSVCLHYYRNTIDANGIVKAVDNLWNTYHKPIWITEIGLFGMKGTVYDMSYELEEKRAEIQNYLSTIVTSLDSKPYVERYCWFPYDVESSNAVDTFDGSGGTAMFEYATGLYTDLGRLYSSIGNPTGYNANTISDSELFDWDSRVRTDVSWDVTTDKLTVTWSEGKLTNLSKVSVKVDDVSYDINSGDQIDTSLLQKGKHTVEFVLYDDNDREIVKKTRSFIIDRSVVPTTTKQETTKETTTEAIDPTQNTTVEPTPTSSNSPVVVTTKTQKKSKPAKVRLSKAKNVKKKSVRLMWKKVAGAKKYKVQWALNKKFTKSKKTKMVSKLTYTIKKLKKKKTYFFRVAAMNSVGIGKWSNIKKVKIKK